MRALWLLTLSALLLDCGGSQAPAPATALAYADPQNATQWRFVKNPASTPTHLVLDLLAPPLASGMGVTFVLSVDGTRAAWAKAGADLVTPRAYAGPLARKASVHGSDLRVVLSQENPTPPVAYGAPVLTVALDLMPTARPGSVALSASQGGHLPAPMASPVPIAFDTGNLTAK